MARLETQINQIYYLPVENKQVALILTDEILNNSSHLFLIAEITDIQKKTEANELKKISEIILSAFRENKKLSGETLLESTLSQINQSLADLAHGGKKSWLGKFSALIAVKSADSVHLANSGLTQALIYRGNEIAKILNPEKPGLHPLKTFTNFASGKLKSDDILLLTTSNLTSYVALENLTKLLSEKSAEGATEHVSKILKETADSAEGFATFFVTLTKPATAAAAAPAPAVSEPKKIKKPLTAAPPPIVAAPVTKPTAVKNYQEPVVETPIISQPIVEEEIYAPLPKDLKKKTIPVGAPQDPKQKLFNRLPKINLPKFSIPGPKLGFWQHLSTWAKFCLIMFLVALLLLGGNIIKYSINKHKQNSQDQVTAAINILTKDMNDAESALIYRNQDEATRLWQVIQDDLAAIKQLSLDAYNKYQPQVADLANRINHITVVATPQVVATLKHPATFMVKAGNGFVFADKSSSAVTTYKTGNSDTDPKELFLLNNVGELTGLIHIPNVGHVVTTASEMYLVNTTQNQFDLLHIYPKTTLQDLRFIGPDRLYTLDKQNNQVLRIQFSTLSQNTPVSVLKGVVNLADVNDFAVDTDVYLLNSTDLKRYTNGNLNTSFKLAQPTDQITSANKMFLASNIYILESAKKRVLIYNKSGQLLTQVMLPNATDLKDIYVDESSRNLYLLDNDKLLSITF